MGVASERLPGGKAKPKPSGTWTSIRSEFNDPEKRTAYWMILPTTVIVLLIAAWPILYAVWLSLQRILPNSTEWVWFNNYTQMFSDPVFYSALSNTFFFTAISVFSSSPSAWLSLSPSTRVSEGRARPERSRSFHGLSRPWFRERCGVCSIRIRWESLRR